MATTPIPTDINTAASGGRRRLPFSGRLVMAFTFFSMFFGAGNLIFPPFVGAQAGAATVPAIIGFIVSAVGLPILGVLAVTFAGGFDELARRVSPAFASLLGVAIMLTIGPCFAIPRTATTSDGSWGRCCWRSSQCCS